MKINVSRIPMFSIDEYDDWRIRVQAHLSALNDKMWLVIEDGLIKITKPSIVYGGYVEKLRSEYTAEDRKGANLDNVARDILFKTLDKSMFSKVKACKIAKENWEKIIMICEGSKKIKENMLSLAMQKFENFSMQKVETLNELDTRFTTLINQMSALGKMYTNK